MIKRITSALALSSILLVSLNSCSPKGDFKKTPGGVEYKILKAGTGTQTPAIGDYVEMNIIVKFKDHATNKDTVLFDSRKVNNNTPVSFPITKAQFKGDPAEAFMMLKTGDSAQILVSVDSLKKAGAQMPPFIKSGDKMEYNVVLVSVKTAAQKKQEDEAKSAAQIGNDDKTLQAYFTANNIKPTKTASGLYYVISKEGTGSNATAGQTVTVNYTGKTLDGKAFDSNVDTNFHHTEPFKFGLGQHQVIAGWDEGVALLKKGSKATFYIPSPLAYGPASPSPAIAPNSILMFDIEVLDISNAATK